MAAALLCLLSRRRAATLAPLIPASMSSYSKPPFPLRAVTAAGGLPDVRRAQLCASPVPSMLRLYATEGCARPAPRQPAHHQATCRLHKQPRFPLQASAAISTILPGSRRMQLSHLMVPSLIRHFSSTGNVLPLLRKLIDPQSMQYLKVLGLAVFLIMVSNWIQIWRFYVGRQYSQHCAIMLWFLDKVTNDLREQIQVMDEALETLEIAVHLLLEHGLDDKASFMFDQGMDKFFKANDICEKVLGDSVKAIGCCKDFTVATREHHRLLCKEVEDRIKMLRQRLKKLSASFETVKTLRKHAKESIPAWMGSKDFVDV